MSCTLGTSVSISLLGESHGKAVGAILDGLPAGLVVDEGVIESFLSLRRPQGKTDTARVEEDKFQIISGVYKGRTNGAPLTILIPNSDTHSSDYPEGLVRPSHADYVAQLKYKGFQDPRGGGHFSGRVTAAIVATGAICLEALKRKGIYIGTHILSCGAAKDIDFQDYKSEIEALNSSAFPLIDLSRQEVFCEEILSASKEGDSIGGKVQTAIYGLPATVGEPWFDSLEGSIAKAAFAIGGVKGIEFGSGFQLAQMRGSAANDAMQIAEDGKVQYLSNHNGGINGGISNGEPVVFNLAVKPTPSISAKQLSFNYVSGENVELKIKGRHDPAIIRRVCIVVSSLISVVICDALALRFGKDYLRD